MNRLAKIFLRLKSIAVKVVRFFIRSGIPPWIFNYQVILKERVDNCTSETAPGEEKQLNILQDSKKYDNPLPQNITHRDDLPDDRGWWGYSFRDVPTRYSGQTFLATVPECSIIPLIDPNDGQFWPAILNSDMRALEIREISFQRKHKKALRSRNSSQRFDTATWIFERVYRNHSHWITAHLPKIILLKERNELDDIIIPPENMRTSVMDDSLRLLDIDPEDFRTFDPSKLLKVKALTLMGSDRFRPELLQSVRDAFKKIHSDTGNRNRIYISRAKAKRRRLLNEEEVFGHLHSHGFKKVFLEDLNFPDQIQIMQSAEVVVAPHGAGLTNVVFSAPQTHVVEIADLTFPNPNFYALSAAMNHYYWLAQAHGVGEGHPLQRDMHISVNKIEEIIHRVLKKL